MRFWRQFAKAQEGIAAVEFALIAPIMIVLFFASVEVSNIMIIDRKVTTVTSAIADLVAQDIEVTDDELSDIFSIGQALLQPFPSDDFSVTVTSVIDNNGRAEVDWSDSFNGGAGNFAVGDLPDGILTSGASVVVVDVRYLHTTLVGYFLTDNVELTDRFYSRPRRVPLVERVG